LCKSERDNLEHQGVDGNKTLKSILKRGEMKGMDWIDSVQEQVAVSCESGNEPSVSTKCGECLDYLRRTC
jgi:hypothetical protein